MKIAFCFLTRADLLQPRPWVRFFAAADRSRFNIYCHPKSPEAIADGPLRGSVIANRVPTRHGGVSIVAATLNLFSAALRADPDNSWFVLLSESAVPIRPFAEVLEDCSRLGSASAIKYRRPAPGSEHEKRLLRLPRPDIFRGVWFHHDQWIVLSRRHVALLRDGARLQEFQKVFAPDEHFFMSALVGLKGVPAAEIRNRRTTFVNWTDREVRQRAEPDTGAAARTTHPKTYETITAADIEQARADGCWFFRKVSAACDCTPVLNYL